MVQVISAPKLVHEDDLANFVRGLQGAAASVLWILYLSDRPHAESELLKTTGYTVEAVQLALNSLAGRQILSRTGSGGWVLAGHIRSQISAAAGEGRRPRHRETGREEGERKALATVLRQVGIQQPAFDWLLERPELQADPALVIAWWWYSLTLSWPENRAGLVIRRLIDGHDPPADYLALNRAWPSVAPADRQEMLELSWRAWTPSQMAARFSGRYPHLTARVFTAFQALCDAAPEELGY